MKERQQLAARCMHPHTVGVRSTPAPATPDPAVAVATDAVREPGLEICKHLAVAHGRSILDHVENNDIGGVWPIGRTGIHDVDPLEVRREADAVRPTHRTFGDYRKLARVGIESIDASRQLEFGLEPFVPPEDPGSRTGEPD